MSLRNDFRRGTFLVEVSNTLSTNHKTITILKNQKRAIPKCVQCSYLNWLQGLLLEILATSSKISWENLGTILLGSRIFTLVPKGIITSLRSGDYANISHSIGYVEFQKVDLVEKAFQLNGTRRSATGCTQ